MNELELEARKAAQDFKNLVIQENDLTAQLKDSRLSPDKKFKLLMQLDKVKTLALEADRRMGAIQKRMVDSPIPVSVAELPKVYVICTRHCQPGRALPAYVVPLNDGVVAVCPECVREGKELQKTLGVKLEEVPVEAKPENGTPAP